MSMTLGTKTLKTPSSLAMSYSVVGAAATLANGDLRRDLIATGSRRVFTIGWAKLTDDELADVQEGFEEAVAADVTFTGPDSISCYVNAGPQPSLSAEAYIAHRGIRYRATMQLYEAASGSN